LAVSDLEKEAVRLSALSERLGCDLLARIPGSRINAGVALRAPHVLSMGISGIENGAALLMALDLEGVAVSGGSACRSGAAKRSHVMAALYGENDGHATVRFSFGRSTTEEDVQRAADATVKVVERMKTAGAFS